MANFTFNKKGGYETVEVDKHIDNLEQQIKVFKDQSATIANAMLSAQRAADNMIKASTEDAKKVIDSAKAEAEKIIADAKIEAETLTAESKTVHAKAVAEAEAEKARILAEANDLAASLRTNAKEQFDDIKSNISQQRELINSFSDDYDAFFEKIFNSGIVEEYQALRDKYIGEAQKNNIEDIGTHLDKITELADELMEPKAVPVPEVKAEAPAGEAPAEEEAKTEEASAEEPKAEEAPAAEETPAEEPKAEEKAEETPAEEPKAEEAPVSPAAATQGGLNADPAASTGFSKFNARPVTPVTPQSSLGSTSGGTDILSRVKAGFGNPEQPAQSSMGGSNTDILSRVKAGFGNPEQPAQSSTGGSNTDILSRVKAGFGNPEQPAQSSMGGTPDILSRVRSGFNNPQTPQSEVAIKTGLSAGKETAGIPAPKSYLEPAKTLAPSSLPENSADQPRKPGVYRVPTPDKMSDQPRKPGVYRVPTDGQN